MKQRAYIQIKVTKKAETSIENGHPWIYDTEILANPTENGALVDIIGLKGNYLGTGILSTKSKIRVRLLSRNANDKFDNAFWERRIRYAWDYRKTVLGNDRSTCRVIFGEADHFPGLTVDLFGDVLVVQTLSFGMELLRPIIFPLLLKVLGEEIPLRGIYERNDVPIRALEGLEQGKGWYIPENITEPQNTSTKITENNLTYSVDFENGQKTGFFLDQKYNRLAVAKLSAGKRVLDCFTHTGSFAMNAAKGGASHVHAVDISEAAITLAKENIILNGLENIITCESANVFDLLPKLEGKNEYDFVILDPPAFTKSRKTIDSATRGYKEINMRAMRLLPRGGYLATCSCSHFMTTTLFENMLRESAHDAMVELRQIEVRQQSPDHPILWNVPETDYLKFYLFQIV